MLYMSVAHAGENMEHSSTSIVEMEKTRFIPRGEYNLSRCRKAIRFQPMAH